ncbi:thyroid receptor-interacting protein 11-like [Mustela putorius furo]|uniref:Thyroid receptor-interacting protein 11-like n=1 Tax=Mustela putorius furo TaxID=9669 RepID=A0A8U0RPB9_MUSPF|nr:thyroid receptor-interacting protein 11-like [Mustela putorius furo]
MREKALALEQLLREKEEGETGELNRLAAAVRRRFTSYERESCASPRSWREGGSSRQKPQDSRRREALASEDRVAQLREEVTVLQGKLVWSSAAMQKASHGARLQVESLREQLHVVTQQKEEAVLRLAASQEEGRHCDQTLASLKLELAEWMEKADALEGNLKSLQGRLHQTNADLEEKEDRLQEFKKQNEVQQEILEDTQRKLMTLVSQSEGMADKALLRRLFVGAFQAADAERQEALSLMASTLGIREDQLRQLRSREPAGVPSGGTGGPGSRSAPNTPCETKSPSRGQSFLFRPFCPVSRSGISFSFSTAKTLCSCREAPRFRRQGKAA